MIKFYGKNDLASDLAEVHQSTKFFTVAFLNNHALLHFLSFLENGFFIQQQQQQQHHQ